MAWKFDSPRPQLLLETAHLPTVAVTSLHPWALWIRGAGGCHHHGSMWATWEHGSKMCSIFSWKSQPNVKCSNPNHVETENSSELVNDFFFWGGDYYCILDPLKWPSHCDVALFTYELSPPFILPTRCQVCVALIHDFKFLGDRMRAARFARLAQWPRGPQIWAYFLVGKIQF